MRGGYIMARKTIREKILTLKRNFPRRTSYGFLYNRKSDLKRKYTNIIMYCLIYSKQKGFSFFVWNPHRRGKIHTALGWNAWINQEGLTIVMDAVLSAINAKGGNDWQFNRLIGFSGADYQPYNLYVVGDKRYAVHESQNQHKRAKRNKAHD